MRCATADRSRSATPPVTDGAANARYTRTESSPIPCRWYAAGKDDQVSEDRTFRLDRIADARTLPGSYETPVGPAPSTARVVRVRHGRVPV